MRVSTRAGSGAVGLVVVALLAGCAGTGGAKPTELAGQLKIMLTMEERKLVAHELYPCEVCPECQPVLVDPPPTPTPVPPPVTPPEKPVEQDSHSTLWKPLSDQQPSRAFWITGAQYSFSTCYVTKKKDKLTFIFRPPLANGNRQHWDTGKPGAQWGKQVKITCDGAGGSKTWVVPDGAVRWETR